MKWTSGPQRNPKVERDGTEKPQPFFADHSLARRVEAAWDYLGVQNTLAQQRRAADAGAEILTVGGGHAVFLGAGSPLSQAQGLGMNGPVREEDLARMEQFFKDRDTPTQIEVASLADFSLLPALCMRGYWIAEQTHCLISCAGDWRLPGNDGGRSLWPGEVAVVQVEPHGLEAWVDVLMNCFFEPPAVSPPALREGALAMALVPGITAWVAKIEGEPAGGGSLMIHDGLALICGDGTLPRFRHRGAQTALLEARLAHARAAGCDLAAICTQPGSGSQRNAERQGFRVVYARTMMVRH
jgi:hypothetical protein